MSFEEYIDKAEANVFMAKVLKATFDSLRTAYADNDGVKIGKRKTRLLFPKYRRKNNKNEELRVSEQELRFVFVEKLAKLCDENSDYFFSVETPTIGSYLFSESETYKELKKTNENLELPCIHQRGVSGNFDMTIYKRGAENKYELVCLIEFKAGSVSEKSFKEVLLKLSNPQEKEDKGDSPLRFLIHLVERGLSKQTKQNYDNALCWLKTKGNSPVPLQDVTYIYGSLKKGKKTLRWQANKGSRILLQLQTFSPKVHI